jgi:WD40 repeat protein
MLISLDKLKLISGGIDGIIKIWCLLTDLLIKSLPNIYNERTWSIKSMINFLNSNEILICSRLRVLRVLNLSAFILELKEHLWSVSCAELLTNEILLSGSFDNTRI